MIIMVAPMDEEELAYMIGYTFVVFEPKEGNDVVFELTKPLVVTYTVNPHEFYIATKSMKVQGPPR